MTTLPNLSIVLPSVGSDTGTWGTLLNTALGLIDAHDHTSGKGLQVPSAGLKINADVSWAFGGTSYAITAIKALDFANVAGTSVSSLTGALFMSDGTGGLVGNELYWRTTSGSNVRLTNGAALNVSAFTGGIGGDYSAVSAALNYDNSNTRYTLKGAAGTNWARMASGEVRIFETGTSESVFVGLAAPAALGASYTLTWPTALPGSTLLTQVDSSGNWSISNTISSAVLMSSTLGVTGLITATAGLTAAANQHLTVSGTGDIKHGTRTVIIHGADFMCDPTSTFTYSVGGTPGVSFTGGAILVWYNVPLRAGDRVTAIRFYIGDSATGPTKLQGFFRSANPSAGTASLIASSNISSGAGAFQTLTISSLTTTITSGTVYAISVSTNTGTNFQQVIGAEIDYDHP